LISEGFQGLDGQQVPEMDSDRIDSISDRYIELFEKITGKVFEKSDLNDIENRIQNNVSEYLNQ